MNYQTNTSYIFVPFIFDRQEDFRPLIARLERSEHWTPIADKITYMLKYVAEKVDSKDKETCQCFHYELNAGARCGFGLATAEDWFATQEPRDFAGTGEPIRFQILSVQLYCFRTTVGILAFRIHLEKDDPLWVANAQYYLKKVSREAFLPAEGGQPTNMLALSRQLTQELSDVSRFQFFYQANPSTERANVLTYLEVPRQDNYDKELFFLRRCYSQGYLYTEDAGQMAKEIFSPSKDIVWGISPEAAVCLACPDYGRRDFLHGTFYKNFNAQYLFMYILLLHQKYVLYMFMTRIGIGTYNNLDALEEFRRQLYEFETDFVFSCVTEVPQYQLLYERMTAAFSLTQMFKDVHEPLVSLREVRREAAENAQKERDDSVNRSLLWLSVLSIFSALIDSFDFIESFFGWFSGGIVIRIVQGCCIVGILVILFFVVKSLRRSRKK